MGDILIVILTVGVLAFKVIRGAMPDVAKGGMPAEGDGSEAPDGPVFMPEWPCEAVGGEPAAQNAPAPAVEPLHRAAVKNPAPQEHKRAIVDAVAPTVAPHTRERVTIKTTSDAKRAFIYSEIFNRKY